MRNSEAEGVKKKKCKGKHGATKIFAKASRRVAGKPVLLFWESGRHSKSSGNDYGLRVHEGVCMRSPKHTSTNMLLRAEEKRRKKKMCLHNPNAAAASYPLNKVSQNWMTALYFGGAACNLPLSGYKTNVNALSSRDCAAAYLHPRKKNTTHAHMRLGSPLKGPTGTLVL